MIVKISEQRTKEGYEITFFTDNKSLFRKARILLDEIRHKHKALEGLRNNNDDYIMEMIENGEGLPSLPPLPDEAINI